MRAPFIGAGEAMVGAEEAGVEGEDGAEAIPRAEADFPAGAAVLAVVAREEAGESYACPPL